MAETDVVTLMDAIPMLIEQLSKAFSELESHEDVSIDKGQLLEIQEHFRKLEEMMVHKYMELDIRETAFLHQETDAHKLVNSQKAEFYRMEQDMLDRIQKLKDAAASAITEALANHKLTSFDPVDAGDSEDSQVSSPLGDSNVFDTGSEVKSPPRGTGENIDVVNPRPELMQICEQMDAKGLLNFIKENQNNIPLICGEVALALKCASEPGRLVLASLEGFYPPDDTNENGEKNTDTIRDMRRSCLVCIKAMATFLAKADLDSDCILSPEIRQQAKSVADEWKPNLANAGTCSASENSLETEAFLQLLATYRIASEFDEEELCKLVLVGAHKRPGPELCRSLGLTHKISGVVKALINSGKQIDAAHFIQAFKLTDKFPTAQLLKAHLKDLRRSLQGKGASSGNAETSGNAQELAALKGIVECVQEYNLEAEYPLAALLRRVAQLESARNNNNNSNNSNNSNTNINSNHNSSSTSNSNSKKRFAESESRSRNPKKPKANGRGHIGSSATVRGSAASNRGRQSPSGLVGRRAVGYGGPSERYPPSSAYDYRQPSSSTPYNQPQQEAAYDPRAHHYPPPDERAAPALYTASGYNYGGISSLGTPRHQP
ncbi:unnamed protein product [Cuscuta epithymum]|uniref:FRIGIDA-like protein n=1 Tax=Cuscuta epithymum TaxID=186058 RepID=A0AAV0FXL7_9ASTE|nr:unnamed protein product [Cuscuta epithymum]